MEKWASEDELADHWLNGLSKFWKAMKKREVWSAAVHGVTKSWTWLSDWRITSITENMQCLNYSSICSHPMLTGMWELDTDCTLHIICCMCVCVYLPLWVKFLFKVFLQATHFLVHIKDTFKIAGRKWISKEKQYL